MKINKEVKICPVITKNKRRDVSLRGRNFVLIPEILTELVHGSEFINP